MKRLVLALLAVFLAGSAAAEDGVTANEIRIGVCTSYEGLNKAVSEQQTAGAGAYIDYVNNELKGVWGRKITLMFENDGFDPVRTPECFNILRSSGMLAQAFVNGAPTAAKYIVLAEERKIPLIGINSGAPFLFEPFRRYTFPTRSSFVDEADELVSHLKETGARKVGVIYQSDAFGANCLQGIVSALQKYSMELASASGLERNSLEVSKTVEAVRAGDPDVVVMAGNSAPQAAVLQLAKKLGWSPRFVVMVGREYLGALAGDAAEGVILSQPFPSEDANLPTVALYGKVMAKYRPKAPHGVTTLDGFVQAMVLVEGLKRAGKDLTREKLVDALEGLHGWDAGLGGSFTVQYTKDKHDVATRYSYAEFKGGKPVQVRDWSKYKKP